MAKRIYALFDRDKDCEHGLGFPYTGTIPCTGPRKCPLCGLTSEQIIQALNDEINQEEEEDADAPR